MDFKVLPNNKIRFYRRINCHAVNCFYYDICAGAERHSGWHVKYQPVIEVRVIGTMFQTICRDYRTVAQKIEEIKQAEAVKQLQIPASL